MELCLHPMRDIAFFVTVWTHTPGHPIPRLRTFEIQGLGSPSACLYRTQPLSRFLTMRMSQNDVRHFNGYQSGKYRFVRHEVEQSSTYNNSAALTEKLRWCGKQNSTFNSGLSDTIRH